MKSLGEQAIRLDEQEQPCENLEKMAFAAERDMRHAAAIHASDVEELRRNLAEAAQRFQDLAESLEKDGHTKQTGFVRASARRYARASGSKLRS